MKTRINPVMVFVLVALAAAACSPQASVPTPAPTALPSDAQSSEGQYQTLTIDQFASILETEGDTYTVVNVHIPYQGEVNGTDAFIPYNDIDALTSGLSDKDAPIILYCRSGNMSEQASQALIAQGYTNLWDVPGGMNAWEASGRELITQAQSGG
jgi:rhodanese-related sulfurtransferase